jgi:hypothetical protein
VLKDQGDVNRGGQSKDPDDSEHGNDNDGSDDKDWKDQILNPNDKVITRNTGVETILKVLR